jgi:hypothetical protein
MYNEYGIPDQFSVYELSYPAAGRLIQSNT